MASFTMNLAMERLFWKFYMINASWVILFFLTAYFFYPETKGLSLEAVATLFEGPQIIEAALEEDDMRKDDVFHGKSDVGITATAA
jgi:hypothetical protein